jgi:hypothetical protein
MNDPDDMNIHLDGRFEQKFACKIPERLKGRTIEVLFFPKENADTQIQFRLNGPVDATDQEVGFLKWVVGEIFEKAGVDLSRLNEPYWENV